KIIIENLPQEKRVRNLLELLDPIGTVQWVYITTDPNTNRSTGQAYAEMWSSSEAEQVVSNLNQKQLDKNTLTVKMVDEKTTPDTHEDKSSFLNAPPDLIYSVVRFQISTPPNSIIFINDIPKGISDDAGSSVIRGLLPGNYSLKVVHQG